MDSASIVAKIRSWQDRPRPLTWLLPDSRLAIYKRLLGKDEPMRITLTANGLLTAWTDALAKDDFITARKCGQTLYDWCKTGHPEPEWANTTQRSFFLRWMNSDRAA